MSPAQRRPKHKSKTAHEAGRSRSGKAGAKRPAKPAGSPPAKSAKASRTKAPRLVRGGETDTSGHSAKAKPPSSGQPAKAKRNTKLPEPKSLVSAEPHPGHWLLTTREGAEQALVDELLLAKVVDPAPRVLGPALVLSPKLPKRDGRPMELTFARQGFEIVQSVCSHDLGELVQRLAKSLRGRLKTCSQYALHVWVPDSDAGNRLSALAEELDEALASQLARLLPTATRVDDATLRKLTSMPLAQVCLIDTNRAAAGVAHAHKALSLAKGGRTRMRITGAFPSRAARKVEEALAWLGVEPGAADLCADLGGAPGGWTYQLAKRRARVIAVDPAQLRPEVRAMRGVDHRLESAFTFEPSEPFDWLFCDMAWRPLEVAALLAKWGRRRWARMLVANIKLPMTRKAEVLARIREILEREGGWKHVRTKQLYHDREEITLTAHTG